MIEVRELVRRTKELLRKELYNEYPILEVFCRLFLLMYHKLEFYQFKTAYDAIQQNRNPTEDCPEAGEAADAISEAQQILIRDFSKTPEQALNIIRAVPSRISGETSTCIKLLGYDPELGSEHHPGQGYMKLRRQKPVQNPNRKEKPMSKIAAVLEKAKALVTEQAFEAMPVIVTLARFLLLHEKHLAMTKEEHLEALQKYNVRGRRSNEKLANACTILRDIRQLAMDELDMDKIEAEKLIECAASSAPSEGAIIEALLKVKETGEKPGRKTAHRRNAGLKLGRKKKPKKTVVRKKTRKLVKKMSARKPVRSSIVSQLLVKAEELDQQAKVLQGKAGELRIEADSLQQHEKEAEKLLQ